MTEKYFTLEITKVEINDKGHKLRETLGFVVTEESDAIDLVNRLLELRNKELEHENENPVDTVDVLPA